MGIWRIFTSQHDWDICKNELKTAKIIPLPKEYRSNIENSAAILAAADDIVAGNVTLFGALRTSLNLTPSGPLHHWSHNKSPKFNGQDIKFIWEPSRFGWAFSLARAYLLTQNESYPATFWQYLDKFCIANPPNTGPNWASAQEVGLRLIALTFAHRVFTSSLSSNPEQLSHLGCVVAAHAARIPSTLLYARAQNNNHLLSEAAALYTAGLTLPTHPQSLRWRDLGWKWFHKGLQNQINSDGSYIQHSTNYHRLMLQIALWVHTLAQSVNQSFPPLSLECLAAATQWLIDLCDPATGRVPNLGPNDGAYILPLTNLPYYDYRPTLQSASRAFLNQPAFPPGDWDEMSLLLSNQSSEPKPPAPISNTQHPTPKHRSLKTAHCLLKTDHSNAYLRAAHFRSRPGHADQLHLDIWWRGLNIALDPGTYLYNADPPWDNTLTSAFVHNTLTINNLDQMTRAGRFLYIHKAQATILNHTPTRISAEHDGYQKLGITHRRTVEPTETGWMVTDELLQVPGSRSKDNSPNSNLQPSTFNCRLHWLLPDWEWKFTKNTLTLKSPFGLIQLKISRLQSPKVDAQSSIPNFSLFRAGQTLLGSTLSSPIWGWYSPTYGVKQPALAFVAEEQIFLPVTLITEWQFP